MNQRKVSKSLNFDNSVSHILLKNVNTTYIGLMDELPIWLTNEKGRVIILNSG